MEWPLVGRDEELVDLQGELAAPNSGGVVIAGQAGVGKTRLAAEIARIAGSQGRSVRHATGTASAQGIPFGGFAHLLPLVEGSAVRTNVLQQAIQTLSEGADPVLVVDDAHLLDDESAALLHKIAAGTGAFVVVTARSGEQSPDAIAALWKDEICRRFDVAPLSRSSTEALIEQVLEGPVERRTHNTLWESSQGNVQYLRELVATAISSNILRRDGELWRLTEPLSASPRLTEIVQARLGRLEGEARRAVELLAFAEPLGVDLIERTCGNVLGGLEKQRIVRIHHSERRLEARLDHPLHSDVLRATTAPGQARSIARLATDVLASTGVRRREDLLRLAVWSLDVGRGLKPEILVRAGWNSYALLDHMLAERLARAALEQKEEFESALLLGLSEAGQKDVVAANAAYQLAASLAETDLQRTDLALARADLLYLVEKRPLDALEMLQDATASVQDEQAVTRLKVRAMLVSSMLGDTRDPADVDRELPEPSAEAAENLAGLFVASSIGQVMLGHFDKARESISIGLGLLEEHQETTSLPAELLKMNQALLDLYSGRVDDADEGATSGYGEALERRAFDVAGMWAGVAAEVLTFKGNLMQAVQLFQESVWLLDERDLFGMMPISRSGLARALALTGELGSSDKAFEGIGNDGNLDADVRARINADRAIIWRRGLEGDVEGAVQLALESGARAVEGSHPMWGAILWHLVVRLGRGAAVAQQLAGLAEQVEGALVPAMAEQARAVERSDPEALEEVASRYQSMGATVLAAEAEAQAASLYERSGEATRSRSSWKRVALLAAGCQGAATPALADHPAILTKREQEIALAAVRGRASKEIAATLDLSVRTVDNHLAAIYGKLGITGRLELRSVLDHSESDELDPSSSP